MKNLVKVITNPLTVEEEFEIEQEVRRILALDDVNELRALGALLMKQNACQSHVLRHSLIKIAELEKRIKTLQARVTTLMKLKFRFLQPLKSILNRNP